MTIILDVLDLAVTLVLLPFFAFMGVLTVASTWNRFMTHRLPKGDGVPGRSRFLFVIPAHDEEVVIATTVQSCLAVQYDRSLFEIYVIADNCEDGTARKAKEAGANVVERSTPDLRSKGHALEYFFTQIPEGRPDAGYDAAILVDADTSVAPDILAVFDEAIVAGKDWVQGYYSVRNPDDSWRTRLMTYAFSMANGVWMRGLEGLSLGVGLKGNGMCFSSRGLRRFPWRAYGLVEDMEFALMLRSNGERVWFEPRALVFGEMVGKGGASAISQRRRWEAGRRSLPGKFAGPIARSPDLGLAHKFAYLIDLYFPPLSTLTMGLALSLGLSALLMILGLADSLNRSLLAAQAVMALTLLTYALSPTWIMGLQARYLVSLLSLPYYIFWKFVVATGGKPAEWVRTSREPRPPA